MSYIGRTLAFAAVPVAILALLGMMGGCFDDTSHRITTSPYRDHQKWSEQMREYEMNR